MKIYTTYTPSHKVLYEKYFLKTLPKNFDLQVFEDKEQLCESAEYHNPGWTLTTKKKIDIFLKACVETMNDVFFYCDVDVQFFDDNIIDILIQELGDYDIACQDDVCSYCSGVFVCKSNFKTLNMFQQMKKNFARDDQRTLNKHLYLCSHKLLPKSFFTTGFLFKKWAGQDFTIPNNIVMHHANWVVGVQNKIQMLDIVRSKYDQRLIC